MCQTDYVCTAWVQGFGRCGRPASWTGKLFRCETHQKKRRRRREQKPETTETP